MLSCEDAVRVNGKFDLDNGNGTWLRERGRWQEGNKRRIACQREFCLSLWIDCGRRIGVSDGIRELISGRVINYVLER